MTQTRPPHAPSDVDGLIAQFRAELTTALPTPSTGLGIDELMRRLDKELGIAHDDEAPQRGDPLPKWTSAQPVLPLRKEYSLHELLQFDDWRFVDTAYRAVLHRAPDPSGREHYLRLLRSGALSRVGVLAALRWSPEGVARGIHVDGLLVPHLLERWQRWPVVGPLIGWARALARLHTLSTRLELLRAAHARELLALGEAHNNLAENASHQLKQFRATSEGNERKLHEMGKLLEARADEIAQLRDALAASDSRWAEQLAVEDDLRRTGAEHAEQLAEVADTLSEIKRARRAREEAAAARDEVFAPLYSRLEDRFRGRSEDISKRVEEYLELVRQGGIGEAQSPVIDVGSGRGEWLDVLRLAGIHAFGIDTNASFVASCRARGLAVTEGDAVQVLKSQPEASAGAVTAMHVVEHLPFDVLVEMVEEAQRVLRPGGLLVLETPNPENVNVGSHWFYLDPTHRNPVPPALLGWLVEDRGFERVEVRRLSAHRDFFPPAPVADDVPYAAQINTILAGHAAAPDFAVVAWRR